MKNFVSTLLSSLFVIIFVIMFLVWFVAFTLGGVEILWWIFTGDFFHFVSTGAEAAF